MNSSDPYGGPINAEGVNADWYRRARDAKKGEARQGLFRPRDQDEGRRLRGASSGSPGHADQFTLLADLSPGESQLVDIGATEESVARDSAFLAAHERFRDAALDALIEASMAHDSEHFLRDRSPAGVTYTPQGHELIARVEIAGMIYEGRGEIRSAALRELSAAVSGGPERAARILDIPQERFATPLDITGEGNALERASRHFRNRSAAVSQMGDGLPPGVRRISDADRIHAAFLSAEIPDDDDIRSLLATREVRAMIRLSVSDDAYETRAVDSIERNEERMQAIELKRTDRYGPSR